MVLCLATNWRNLEYISHTNGSFLLLALRVRVVGDCHGVGVERIEAIQCEPPFLPVLSKFYADIILLCECKDVSQWSQ